VRAKDFRVLSFDNAACISVQFAILESPALPISYFCSTRSGKSTVFVLDKSLKKVALELNHQRASFISSSELKSSIQSN